MTQDCLDSPSTADVGKRSLKGISVTGTGVKSASGIEGMPWGYLYVHNKTAQVFEKEMKNYNKENPASAIPCFVHRTVRLSQKKGNGGVKKEWLPTISGLVFLQGRTRTLQKFLQDYYPQYHLVNDRSTRQPASIADKVMQPFMTVLKDNPEKVTFLRDSFEKFAKDHVKLRVLTGLFVGCEGYIVRIDRDRQLVFDFGGYAVAIRGVHKEDFEVVEE